ncbi:MAG: prepilin-type N-terminal cleavage/methylation domain-containing protein [Solirubrobacterales bacterium]|nr:prepilin-type N-terminal cleavage/methylation domain-containing protein [Solirubrobacterales bacterium]
MAEERGLALVELLVALVISGVVLGATLTTFAQFERTTGVNQSQNEAQDRVRVGLAGVARELRNLASPTDELPFAIVRADGDDLVFQSVSSTVTRRVRYCLDASSRRLWRQVQLAPFSEPTAGACPDAAWGSQRTAIQDVVNGERPVFGYNVEDPMGITEISATVWVDVNPGKPPVETSLQTAIFLRNQNRSPTASFTATLSGTNAVVLNGSDSFDPEGRSLRFFWYDDAETATGLCGVLPPQVPQAGCVATGIVATYLPPAAGTRTLRLVVSDPAGLTAEAPAQTVCLPGGDLPC